MKHPNKRQFPSSIASRTNAGQLIKIKPHEVITGVDSISCNGATTSASFTVVVEEEQVPKVYHTVVVNGMVHNADNKEDIVGNTYEGGDVTATVINDTAGQIRLVAQAYSGGVLARVKLIPPASEDIANNIIGIAETGAGGGPNNPTIAIDAETKVVTMCIGAAISV